MSNNFTVGAFYSKRESKLARDIKCKLEKTEAEMKSRPLPPDFSSDLLGPPVVWRIFFKQDDALRFAAGNGEELMTFAFEDSEPGKRRFLVTHPLHFWASDSERQSLHRHTYEVIPQGKPCKLYFDLEFLKALNPNSNGEKMTDLLIKAAIWALRDVHGVSAASSDVLILDSSTDSKFSQHLIFQTEGCIFEDNSQAGHFVSYIDHLLKNTSIPELTKQEQNSLFVESERQEKSGFYDMGVYSKNRNFRLLHSSKHGKNTPLLVAPNNQFKPKEPSINNIAHFQASLITHFPDRLTNKTQLLKHHLKDRKMTAAIITATAKPDTGGSKSSSPWTEIDTFINEKAAPGYIKKWVYFQQTQTIVYTIEGDRYCKTVGRQHKQNAIKYIVSIANSTYYQSCFDSECNILPKPTPEPIPEQFLPWYGLLRDPIIDPDI